MWARGRGSPFISALVVPRMGWLSIGVVLANAWRSRAERAREHRDGGGCMRARSKAGELGSGVASSGSASCA
jgi:hypothetical protein